MPASAQAELLAMICATLFPFLSRQYAFTPADHDGSRHAEHQMILWLLRTGLVNHCYLFLEANASAYLEPAREAIAALPAEVRSKIRIADLLTFDVDAMRDLVFLSNVPDFRKPAALRRVMGAQFPICSLVHSVVFPGLLDSYLSVLVAGEPPDALVANSTTAQRAVESIMTQARGVLSEAIGLPDCGKLPGPSVHRLPLGVDDSILEDTIDMRAARSILGIARDAEVILYLGRLSERYKADLEPLLRAFSRLIPGHPQTTLMVAGQDVSGSYTRSLEELCGALGLNSKVRFIVNFPPYTKHLIYSAADVFVSPAENIQESFGIAILEAMANGLPVVASNWSGYRDLIEDSKTGFLIGTWTTPSAAAPLSKLATIAPTPTAEHYFAARTVIDVEMLVHKLDCLLGSQELRRTFGTAGQRRVRTEYCWSVVVPQFVALWKEQLEMTHAHPFTRRKYLRYEEFLSLYPSEACDLGSAFVGCSMDAVVSFMRQYGKQDPRLNLLQLCSSSPRSFRELTAFRDAKQQNMAADTVIRLIKKGILHVHRPAASLRSYISAPTGSAADRPRY